MKWIYLMDVLPTLATACVICAIITMVVTIVYLIYCNDNYCRVKLNTKILVTGMVVFLFFTITAALIPGKRALATMAVESSVTNEQIKDIAAGWLKR